jgi:hypothetical protein
MKAIAEYGYGSPDVVLEGQDIEDPVMQDGGMCDANISALFSGYRQDIGGPYVVV